MILLFLANSAILIVLTKVLRFHPMIAKIDIVKGEGVLIGPKCFDPNC